MKNINITKTFLTLASCFILAFIFCAEIPAQRDVKKKDQTKTEKPTTETPSTTQKETPATTPKETPSTNSKKSDDRKKIIVVLDFDDVTLGNQKMEIGRQVAILLANEFSKNGTYKVVERQRIAQILREQDLTFDERFDKDTAATVGKALSANPVVLGSITEYTTKKSGIAIMGVGKIKITAKIGLAIRLVDVNTGEILNSVTVEGTAFISGVNAGVYQKDTIVDEDLRVTLFTQAANNAVGLGVQKLSPIIDSANNFASSNTEIKTPTTKKPDSPIQLVPTRTVSIPKVAAIVGTNVYITGLAKDIKVGDLFSIIRGIEIKNEAGEVIDFDGKEIAKVEVIEVRENTVKAKIIKGTGIREKDFVQPIK